MRHSPYMNRHTRPFIRDLAWYDDRARGLVEVHAGGLPNALEQIRRWHPQFTAASVDEIRAAPFTLDDARLVYAREHGFDDWDDFATHVDALANGDVQEPFLDAYEAIVHRDAVRLEAMLGAHPELVHACGTNGNTLLNLACSLAARDHRSAAAADPLAFVMTLLHRGADVSLANDRGWTPLHQAAYSGQLELARRLLAAGARVDAVAHGEGGTPLVVALFWGHRAVADLLAGAGVAPNNLRVAAGLGRADLIARCFTPNRTLTTDAGAARGFYRPHSGFPVWQPSNDPQEILDEALVWAARNDRVDVLPWLVERGANVAADPYRGTPLLWATACGATAAIAWLLDHGADVNQRATFGGASHGQGATALHLAAQRSDAAVAMLLVARGADPTIRDDRYHCTAADWAEHGGSAEVQRYLRSLSRDSTEPSRDP
ncbi:MAG TPA: ankyrin repeat domain-containing protein [Gemmatimonadaceae bacterium]|nr:ankyrin repeat domain-containing protein [Gemmatimonadaceae bacterium]